MENNEQLMKFKITNNKLKMEIKIADLVWLFHNSPNNMGVNGEGLYAKVKRGKRREFAEYIVEMLSDYNPQDENNTRWGQPLEDIFNEIFEGAEDFCKYCDCEE
jgi:hypothetical protein